MSSSPTSPASAPFSPPSANRRPKRHKDHPMRTFQNLLVTGGAGFIGSNFIRHVFEKTDRKSVV